MIDFEMWPARKFGIDNDTDIVGFVDEATYTYVTQPWLSVCGRFVVTPLAYGFKLHGGAKTDPWVLQLTETLSLWVYQPVEGRSTIKLKHELEFTSRLSYSVTVAPGMFDFQPEKR